MYRCIFFKLVIFGSCIIFLDSFVFQTIENVLQHEIIVSDGGRFKLFKRTLCLDLTENFINVSHHLFKKNKIVLKNKHCLTYTLDQCREEKECISIMFQLLDQNITFIKDYLLQNVSNTNTKDICHDSLIKVNFLPAFIITIDLCDEKIYKSKMLIQMIDKTKQKINLSHNIIIYEQNICNEKLIKSYFNSDHYSIAFENDNFNIIKHYTNLPNNCTLHIADFIFSKKLITNFKNCNLVKLTHNFISFQYPFLIMGLIHSNEMTIEIQCYNVHIFVTTNRFSLLKIIDKCTLKFNNQNVYSKKYNFNFIQNNDNYFKLLVNKKNYSIIKNNGIYVYNFYINNSLGEVFIDLSNKNTSKINKTKIFLLLFVYLFLNFY